MVTGLNALRDEALRIATEHGFSHASFGEMIALMHSELSEALEDFRVGNAPGSVWYGENDKPCGIPIEFADVLIRVLHCCGVYGIDIEEAIAVKMKYNEGRPYMHGKVL